MSELNKIELVLKPRNDKSSENPVIDTIIQSSSKVQILINCPDEHDFHHILKDLLDEKVIWQSKAKKIITDTIVWQILSFRNRKGPIACLLFAWPTWVWKTEIVKALSKSLLWNENSYTKINCENYQESHSNRNLFWAPKSYVWYGEPTPLDYKKVVSHYDSAKKLWEIHDIIRPLNDFSIILFDEIEKAHPDVRQSLLTLMDEGKIEFSNWEIANFKNCLIIFTSNIWEHEISQTLWKQSIWFNQNNQKEENKSEIRNKKIKENFSPEFLWRVTKIIEFEQLSENDIFQIINIHLKLLNNHLSSYYIHSDISISFTKNCYDYILNKWYSKEKWARELIRNIDIAIENKLNILLNSEEFSTYLEKNTPVVIKIDFKWENIQFYIEYYEDDIQEINLDNTHNINNELSINNWNEKKWISPLKKINTIFSEISQYVELYHVSMDWDIDFRVELREIETQLKVYGFTNSDIICLRNRAYIEAIEELQYITTFDWLNIFNNEKKDIFHPYKQRIILKIVEKKIKENVWEFRYQDFWVWILSIISAVVKKLLKVEELQPIQIQELLIYIRKVMYDKYKS